MDGKEYTSDVRIILTMLVVTGGEGKGIDCI